MSRISDLAREACVDLFATYGVDVDVTVQSTSSGSTFSLRLPRVPRGPSAGRVAWRGGDAAIRVLGAAALAVAGYTVATAPFGDELAEIVVGTVPEGTAVDRLVRFDPRRDHLSILVDRLAAWR